ncbi:MAG: S8 family serine peptidase, partial [bacterium]
MFPLVSSSRSFLKSIIATLVAVILLVQSSLPVSATLPVTVPEMAGTVEGAESSLPVLSLESEEEFGFSEETSGEIPDERLEEAPVSDEISEENPVEVPSETLAEPKEPDVPDVASEIPSESDTEPEVVESEDAESILIEREAVEVFEFEEEPVIGGDIIVRYKGQPGDMKVMGRRRTIGALAESHNLALLPVGLNDSIDEVIQELLDDPNVEYAEPNYEFYSQENLSPPNDPEFSNQWALEEVTVLEAWSEAFSILEREDMPPASVTVAVVDTGVDSEHKDLKRVLPGYNAISGAEDRDDSSDDSRNGHGTHVAGIIAAETNNEVGIASITGEFPVNILPVKVLDSAGVGSMYDVAQGIYWAANNGAQVINLSLGARLPDYPKTLADAVKYAQDRGILVVAAAGNDGGEVDGFYPACLPGVLAVGASGRDHHRALFSNWGALVVAPGIDILSTLPNNHYGELSGTSQAAAFASGTAALLWAVLPEKSAGEVAESIREGRGRYSDNSGYHYVLSAYQALIQLDYHNTAPGPYG